MDLHVRRDRLDSLNKLTGDPAFLASSALNVAFEGASAAVHVGKPLGAVNVQIVVGEDASVAIEEGCVLGSLFIYASAGASVTIGRGSGFNGRVRLLLHEARSITIGEECLFGGNVDVTVSDMHSIFDCATNERINSPADVTIGDRVWVGEGALLLKGTQIAHDSVIGARSVVTKPVPSHCIAAGNPARVVRQGITWSRDLVPY